MATLTRTRPTSEILSFEDEAGDAIRRRLQLDIPKPFPNRSEWEQDQELEALANEDLTLDEQITEDVGKDYSAAGKWNAEAEGSTSQSLSHLAQLSDLSIESRNPTDLVPSIAHVQMSCLTTLNDLLSTAPTRIPIIPDRRRSLPASAIALSSPSVASPASALETLVTNLRTQELDPDAAGTSHIAAGDAELFEELQQRVDRLAEGLPAASASLARTLASLAVHTHRLALLHPAPTPRAHTRAPLSRTASWTVHDEPFARLRHDLGGLRIQEGAGPAEEVEAALLWAKLDEELEQVLNLCRISPPSEDNAPPDYQPPEYEHAEGGYEWEGEGLPRYEAGSSHGASYERKSDAKHEPLASPLLSTSSEKMRMDLEAVTLAIDRLYLVAPQLHNQRVELKKSKLEEMEKARRAGAVRSGKQRENDVQELERMVAMIGKATERKMVDQAVVIEGGMAARLEKARQRDREKREAFVTQLAQHSDAGRLHSQDAALIGTRPKDPHAMLTLPEFIREAIPQHVREEMRDPRALLSLPEFVREEPPKDSMPSRPQPPSLRSRNKSMTSKGTRSRSMSAPPLAWLLQSSSSSRPASPVPTSEQKKIKSARRPGSSSGLLPIINQTILDVYYVAEYHENLQHVLVFMTVSGMKAGVDLEAEVLSDASGDARSYLLLRCGGVSSPLLSLPAKVQPGRKEVKVSGQHYEIKLPVPSGSSELPSHTSSPALLDATDLSTIQPSSYICSSCSLPLVQSSRLGGYRDLPSEHWEELVDAWMCHGDQKLHSHVMQRSVEGFWPSEDQALVGGSYILFDESAMVKNNCWLEERKRQDDEWRRVRCICGAVVGRSRDPLPSNRSSSKVYRLAKYAIRPVSATAEPLRVPLTAFIAEDMSEFVQAHATYRFVILDEEEERPRILVWLFKPSMQIAYTTPTQYVIPKSGAIHAAKVLYKFLAPNTTPNDLQEILQRHPGFPQAEHLYYPLDICRRLAAHLKESNTAYPENMRTMTGLDVGWLQRI